MPGEKLPSAPAAIPLQVVLDTEPIEGLEELSNARGWVCSACKKGATIVCGGCMTTGYCTRQHQLNHWAKHRDTCRPFVVVTCEGMGRCMVATRDITAGELLLEDPPLLLGPKMITEPVCLGCYCPATNKSKCSKCGFPMCGSDCEAAPDHEPECQAIKNSGHGVRVTLFGEINSIYESITPIRMLATRERNPEVWEKLMSMESHLDKRDGTELANITQQTVVDIMRNRMKLTEYEPEMIQQILGIIDTNGFEIRLPDSSILGVYFEAAMLEHDCVPNTHRTFDADLNLVVRSSLPIKRGEHLTNCYTDPLTTTAERLDHLRTSKFFTCRCSRCLDPTELKTYLSALRCSDCSPKGDKEKTSVRLVPQSETTPSTIGTQVTPRRGRGTGVRLPGGSRRGVANRASVFGAQNSPPQAAEGHAANGAIPGPAKEEPSEQKQEAGPWILPVDPLSPSSLWKCMSCGAPTTDDYPAKITQVVGEEAEELEETSTIATCEAFLEKWAHLFHPNHAVFLNVKYALLHLYGSEEGSDMDDLNPMQLIRKEELCRQVLKIADVIVPGISRLRGSVQYELYQALFYKTKVLTLIDVVTDEQARRIAQEACVALKECARVLSYEPAVQPEGQLGIEAKEEVKQLQQWINTEGWK